MYPDHTERQSNKQIQPIQNIRAEHGMLTADLGRCSSRPAITGWQALRDEHNLAAYFCGR